MSSISSPVNASQSQNLTGGVGSVSLRTSSLPKDPCAVCSTTCTSNSAQCSLCLKWVHAQCSGLKNDLFACLTKLKDKKLKLTCIINYICPVCAALPPKNPAGLPLNVGLGSGTINDDMSLKCAAIDVKVDKLDKKLDNLIAGIMNVQIPADKSPNRNPKTVNNTHSASNEERGVPQNEDFYKQFSAYNEEKLRSRSLIMANLPENGNDFDDATKVCQVLDKSVTICHVFRLGKQQQQKPRLLKVELQSSTVVRSLLSESKRLKNLSGFNKVYLRQSLAKADRIYLGRLYSSCKALNTEAKHKGEGDKFVVVNGNLLKYSGCAELPDGRLGRGRLDRDFNFIVESAENSQSQSKCRLHLDSFTSS